MAVFALVFIILHLGAGLALPYKPGYLPYFYRWMEESGLDFEKRLNRPERASSARALRGVGVGLLMGALAALVGCLVWMASRHGVFGIIIMLVFLSCCITFMTPMKVVRQIQKHLQADQLPEARAVLQPYVQEPLENEDVHTVIRKTIEFIAISLNCFLLAPVFWFVIGGPLGLALYVAFSALGQAVGPPDERRKAFGRFIRGIDTVLNIVPAAISAFFLMISALFVSGSSPWRAGITVYQQSRGYGLFYKGWLIAALAGGLGVTLGGPVRYSADYSENHEWVGPPQSTARLLPEDLSRAALLQYAFFLCIVLLISVLMILKP